MNLRTGQRVVIVSERQRSEEFQSFLRALHQECGDKPIVLLLDEDSSHTAKASVALASKLNIRLLWLPKRAPELNPMETLWKHTKDLLSANKQYASIDEQAALFVRHLQSLTDYDALHKSGILSDDCWLKSAR
jgi:transposase